MEKKIKCLMLSKTSDGGFWAALLANYLKEMGIDIYIVLPKYYGACVKHWVDCATEIFFHNLNIRGKSMIDFPKKIIFLKNLINSLKPDIIHSFFFDTTIVSRIAFWNDTKIPCIFHVPGPLHLENVITRFVDKITASYKDYWIASSAYTYNLYLQYGFPSEKVFLAYFGFEVEKVKDKLIRDNNKIKAIKEKMGISNDKIILMNANYFYPPRIWLGQTVGVKNHESLILSMKYVLKERDDICLVLAGRQWGKGEYYERYLRGMARIVGKDNIYFIGYLEQEELWEMYNIADIIVHVPISENCGGIVEPALLKKPVIITPVGGLLDIVEDEDTGWITSSTSPKDIALKILEVAEKRNEWQEKGEKIGIKVKSMFNIENTSKVTYRIYERILSDYDLVKKNQNVT
jgi:glycosyltransferase involved in cell wall biosynthesis